jgi:hypothetical protein
MLLGAVSWNGRAVLLVTAVSSGSGLRQIPPNHHRHPTSPNKRATSVSRHYLISLTSPAAAAAAIMRPSSSSTQPPDQPGSRSPSPPSPAMGYPVNLYPNPAAASPRANGTGAFSAAAFGVADPFPPHSPHHHPPSPHPFPPPCYHYPPRPRRHRNPPHPPSPTRLHRLLALAVGGIVFLTFAIVIFWLLCPCTPAFYLASLNLSGVAYSQTNSTISASFDTALLASNPNSKLSVTYYYPLASVSITPSSLLAVASLYPFLQGPDNTTTLAFLLAVEHAYVGPDDAGAFKSGSNGTAEVDVRFTAQAVFARWGWSTRRRLVRVKCDHVPVVFRGKNSTEASFSGPPRQCYVAF